MYKRLIIGITGAFGSGCSSVATYLESNKFKYISISNDILGGMYNNIYPLSQWANLSRREKQLFGNEVRTNHYDDYLYTLHECIQAYDQESINQGEDCPNIVLECFRNPQEIGFLNEIYREFFLFAIYAGYFQRWTRFHTLNPNANEDDFEHLDRIDEQEEDNPLGQNVKECVKQADVIINNDLHWQEPAVQTQFYRKVNHFIQTIKTGEYIPTPSEVLMNEAYSVSFQSDCLKRQVGAVVTTPNNEVISVGYNAAPRKSTPCVGECYREHRKRRIFNDMNIHFCPMCNTQLNRANLQNYTCPNNVCQIDFLKLFFPGKELDYCKSIHAEEKAILDVPNTGKGVTLQNCTIYSTTFPCNLCAKKIAEVGIKKVVYVEPYPVREAKEVLEENEVELEVFEGIKAKAYYRVYSNRAARGGV